MVVFLAIPKIALSLKGDGVRPGDNRPAPVNLLVILVLSLLPPVMVPYAGIHSGGILTADYSIESWLWIGVMFFCAEMATLAAMGWLIQRVAATHQIVIEPRDAYRLACIAPIPLWLSSVALLAPDWSISAGVPLLAMAASCHLIHRGILTVSRVQEGLVAASITQTVMGASLVGWALVLLAVLSV